MSKTNIHPIAQVSTSIYNRKIIKTTTINILVSNNYTHINLSQMSDNSTKTL